MGAQSVFGDLRSRGLTAKETSAPDSSLGGGFERVPEFDESGLCDAVEERHYWQACIGEWRLLAVGDYTWSCLG